MTFKRKAAEQNKECAWDYSLVPFSSSTKWESGQGPVRSGSVRSVGTVPGVLQHLLSAGDEDDGDNSLL